MISLEFLSTIPHLLFLHISKKVKNHVAGKLDILTGITLFYNGEERDSHEITRWAFLFFLNYKYKLKFIEDISSVTQSSPSHCNPMDCSTPVLPVHHQLLEFTQTHVHWVSDTIQPPHPLLSPFPPAFSLSQHQMNQLFALGDQSVGVSASTSVLPMNIQDWFPLEWTGWISLKSNGLSRVFTNTTVQKHQFLGAQLSL